MKITLELEPEQAAGLMRFADKVTHADAMAVLYAHRPLNLRNDQAHAIMDAFSALSKALSDANISTWPWIDTGTAA